MVVAGATLLAALGLASLQQRTLTRATGAPVEKASALSLKCKKVVCLGTSVTKGKVRIKGGGLAAKVPYSAKLQELLGPSYCVENYGMSGISVLKSSDTPIWKKSQLQELQNMLPDIVLLHFGARDTIESNFKTDFSKDYGSLISLFTNLPSRPQVYLLSVAPFYPGTASAGHEDRAYGLARDHVNSLHVPLHHLAKDTGIPPPVSVFNVFRNKCPDMNKKCTWMSEDGVHPNDDGHAAIAQLLLATIMDDDMCPASDAHRTACGSSSSTQAQCRDLGCCYTPAAVGGLPQCYHKAKPARATPMQCFVTPFQKTSCGYHSDNMQKCMERGCCYKPSLDGSPWCFHKKPAAYKPPEHPTNTHTTKAAETTKATETTKESVTRKSTSTATTVTVTKTITTSSTTITTPTTTTTTTTTRTTVTVTMTATHTTMTSTASSTTTTTTTVLNLVQQGEREVVFLEHQPWMKPALLTSGGLLTTAFLSWIICWIVRIVNQPQISFASEVDARHLQEDEEQRQLRRLEVDMALRRVEENRRQRELDSMLTSAGFTGVNDPKTKKGMFRSGYTYPLHAAVEANSPEAVQMLVRAGADINLQDSKKRTPLQLAEQLNKGESHQEVIQALGEA